ncbi:MAG: hypothetical protein R3F20_15530 [Planctomycetota bacterium]
MRVWRVGDEDVFLVALEEEKGGGYLLVDGAGGIEAEWADEDRRGGGSRFLTRHEIEDDAFLRVQEERFASGRANYDREILLEELEALDADEIGLDPAALAAARRRRRRRN